jgi:signal transduction histidine kinase
MPGIRPESLQCIAESQLAGEQILAVAFLDAAGKPVAWARRDGIDAASLQTAGVASRKVETTKGEVLVSSVPVLSADSEATAQRVVVITSMRSIGHSTRAMVQLIVLVGTGVTSTAAMLGWLLLRRSRRPLKDLVRSVRNVIAGKAESLSEDCDNEDVAEIAIAFNELIVNLRTNRAQLATANEELASLIRGLEQKVADRTAQLEAANGRLSGEIAEKEDFLRAVSHDLNAPLRNIGGMVSMLMLKNRDSLPDEVVSRLERIRKNVDVETDLINELLELSRIKTRRQTLELVDTESVVWELRGTFENDLKTRHIDMVLETSLPPLYAERARIRQVFQNLIDNAIKYMGDGPVREIRIGCRVSVTEAAFYVRDTGLGIHPEDLDKVFFVFRRGRGEVSQKVPGKGVGLSSVKSIIETYAGQIRVESTYGAGSAFHFTINGKFVPMVAGQTPAEMGTQRSQPTPTLAPSAYENRAA